MLEDLFKTVKSRMNIETAENKKGKVNIPFDVLFKCLRCQNVVFMEEFERNKKVCAACGYHARISARERIELTVDKGSFTEYDPHMQSCNPIEFPDYEKKIAAMREATGLNDGVVTGECSIRSQKCVMIVMDSRFMMSSMGSVAGEKITRAFERATRQALPVVAFTASGGARMQEGIISLMQMAKTSGAVARHNDAGLLYITVWTDPTTGGVMASFASLGDIIIAEPKVLVGFAGRRVIEGTIRQRLPDDFQSAEFMLQHGQADMIVSRTEMRRTIANLLRIHSQQQSGEGQES